ncbi:MAG: MurR/RpiR family transcriptional regulator [Peptococcaceae bacterium]|nr:MurR/RpiR family transcriptional regulator [Peptococcaceae bacterium]
MNLSLSKRIQEKFPSMSSNHRKLAEFILQHYDKAVFLTALELGQTLGMSESTVIRFANMLGYDGYPQLNKALQDMIKNKITTVERHRLSLKEDSNVLEWVFHTDMENLRKTMADVNVQDFRSAVQEIIQARNIYIISLRSATALGQFLHFYLHLLLKNSRLISGTGTLFEELLAVGPKDVVIGISFPRYSRQTIEGLKYAQEKGAHTLAITDSVTSPLSQYSKRLLVAHSHMGSFIDSFVAPLSLINALIIAVGTAESEKTTQALSQLEDIWARFKTYYSE